VITSVVGAYYYLRIVKVMYFDEPAQPFDRDMGWSVAAIAGIATVFTLLFVVRIDFLLNYADLAAQALRK
jgi:NADH-quinone oxidoreductase subunit N